MSDYMFMLESHLTGEQYRVVGQMQAAAGKAGLSLYLTGGALRDVLGGFPVRDLDFTVEGNALKLAKTAAIGSQPSPTMASKQTDGTPGTASCAVAA